MSEQESSPIGEEELSPGEVARLRSTLWSKISEAIALGVFQSKDASAWEAGFEACAELEHMEELVAVIDNFVAAGVAVLEQLEKNLDDESLSASDRNLWHTKVDSADYHERKNSLIPELKRLIAEVRSLKSELDNALGREGITDTQKGWFAARFRSASAPEKASVVSDARTLEPDTIHQLGAESITATVEPEATSETESESTTDDTEPTTDPKADCQTLIGHYLKHNQFQAARNQLAGSERLFDLREHRELVKSITKAQLEHVQSEVQAAYGHMSP